MNPMLLKYWASPHKVISITKGNRLCISTKQLSVKALLKNDANPLTKLRIHRSSLYVNFRAMTIVSVVLGRTFHYVDEILPFRYFSGIISRFWISGA